MSRAYTQTRALVRIRGMKRAFIALVLLSVTLVSCQTRPLRTVESVDLRRYVGLWYEVARLPNAFQRDDSRATAEYNLKNEGSIHVVNTEYRPDGNKKIVAGQGTVVPESRGSRLVVRFPGLAALLPEKKEGNYWVIACAPDYSVALVGTPDRRFLWLLARQPNLPPSIRDQYLEIARQQGFLTGRMIIADWKTMPAR